MLSSGFRRRIIDRRLSLLYLMVLIDSHTISKSIDNEEKVDDILDSINELDHTRNPKLRNHRHKYRVDYKDEYVKPPDAFKDTKLFAQPERVTEKHSRKSTVEHAKHHKSPKRRVGSFWRKFKGKDKKNKHVSINDSNQRKRRISKNREFQASNRTLNDFRNVEARSKNRRKHRNQFTLQQPKLDYAKREKRDFIGHIVYSTNTPPYTEYKAYSGTTSQFNNIIKNRYEIRTTGNVDMNHKASELENTYLRGELASMTTQIGELKEMYGLKNFTSNHVSENSEKSPAKATTGTTSTTQSPEPEFSGTAQIEELLNNIKVKAIEMVSDQSPAVTDIITNTVTESTFEADPILTHIDMHVPVYNIKPQQLVTTNNLEENVNEKRRGLNEFNINNSVPIAITESHYVAARSIKEDSMTMAQNVEDMLQRELKNLYKKVKNKMSSDFSKEVHRAKSTIKEGICKISKKTCTTKTTTTCTTSTTSKTTTPKPKKCNNKVSMSKYKKLKSTTPQRRTREENKEENENAESKSTYDDYLMLTLYEQMLAKSHESNVRKMLETTDFPLIKTKKRRDHVKLSKRNAETFTNVQLKEAVQKLYDDGTTMPDYDYAEPSGEGPQSSTTMDNTGDNTMDDNLESSPNKSQPTSPTAGEDESATGIEGLSNQISYNDFVNGFRHYLKFQREQGNQNFSALVKYQAHRHHSVDDIGKFILNKIPPVPSIRKKRFFDDSDIDYQEITTKSDDSWFRKHFYLFIDNGPPKKFHTSQTVALKSAVTENPKLLYTEPTQYTLKKLDDQMYIRIGYDETTKDTQNVNLEDLTRLLSSIKERNSISPSYRDLPKGLGITAFNGAFMVPPLDNYTTDSIIELGRVPQSFMHKILNGKRRQVEGKVPSTSDIFPEFETITEDPKMRVKRTVTQKEHEISLIDDFINKDLEDKSFSRTTDLFGSVTPTTNKDINKYGYVDIDVVPGQTAIVSLRENPKQSKLKNFFKKFHFGKKNKSNKKHAKRSYYYEYDDNNNYGYINTRRARFNALQKLKDIFGIKKETEHNSSPSGMVNMPDDDMIASRIETFKPVKYDKPLNIDEMQRQIPNISYFEAPPQTTPTTKISQNSFNLDENDQELLSNYLETAVPTNTYTQSLLVTSKAKPTTKTTPATIKPTTRRTIELTITPTTRRTIEQTKQKLTPAMNVMTINVKTLEPVITSPAPISKTKTERVAPITQENMNLILNNLQMQMDKTSVDYSKTSTPQYKRAGNLNKDVSPSHLKIPQEDRKMYKPLQKMTIKSKKILQKDLNMYKPLQEMAMKSKKIPQENLNIYKPLQDLAIKSKKIPQENLNIYKPLQDLAIKSKKIPQENLNIYKPLEDLAIKSKKIPQENLNVYKPLEDLAIKSKKIPQENLNIYKPLEELAIKSKKIPQEDLNIYKPLEELAIKSKKIPQEDLNIYKPLEELAIKSKKIPQEDLNIYEPLEELAIKSKKIQQEDLNMYKPLQELTIKSKLARLARFPISRRHYRSKHDDPPIQIENDYPSFHDSRLIKDYIDKMRDRNAAFDKKKTEKGNSLRKSTQPGQSKLLDDEKCRNADYFNDLIMWHNDILNLDKVPSPLWKNILKNAQAGSEDLTTPNVPELMKELNDINAIMEGERNKIETKTSNASAKVERAAPGVRRLFDGSGFPNQGLIRNVVMDDHAVITSKDMVIKGEAKYYQYNNKPEIIDSQLKSIHLLTKEPNMKVYANDEEDNKIKDGFRGFKYFRTPISTTVEPGLTAFKSHSLHIEPEIGIRHTTTLFNDDIEPTFGFKRTKFPFTASKNPEFGFRYPKSSPEAIEPDFVFKHSESSTPAYSEPDFLFRNSKSSSSADIETDFEYRNFKSSSPSEFEPDVGFEHIKLSSIGSALSKSPFIDNFELEIGSRHFKSPPPVDAELDFESRFTKSSLSGKFEPAILMDTTILAYDSDLDFLTKDLDIKKLSRNPQKIMKVDNDKPAKHWQRHSPFLKTNKAPRQYYSTPMPMKSYDFNKFLKENDMDVESVTSPILDLPNLKDTKVLTKIASNEPIRPLLNDTLFETQASAKQSKSDDVKTLSETLDKSIKYSNKGVIKPNARPNSKNKNSLSFRTITFPDDFDRHKRYSEVNKLIRNPTTIRRNIMNKEDRRTTVKYYNMFKKAMKEKLFEKKATNGPPVAVERPTTGTSSMDPRNKEVEITIINFDDLDKIADQSSETYDIPLKKEEVTQMSDFTERTERTTELSSEFTQPFDFLHKEGHNGLLYKDIFKEFTSSRTTEPTTVTDYTKSTEYVNPVINDMPATPINKEFNYPFDKLPNLAAGKMSQMNKNFHVPKRVHISSHHYKYDIFYDDNYRKSTKFAFEAFRPKHATKATTATSTLIGSSRMHTMHFRPMRSYLNSRKVFRKGETTNNPFIQKIHRTSGRNRFARDVSVKQKRRLFTLRGCKPKPEGGLTGVDTPPHEKTAKNPPENDENVSSENSSDSIVDSTDSTSGNSIVTPSTPATTASETTASETTSPSLVYDLKNLKRTTLTSHVGDDGKKKEIDKEEHHRRLYKLSAMIQGKFRTLINTLNASRKCEHCEKLGPQCSCNSSCSCKSLAKGPCTGQPKPSPKEESKEKTSSTPPPKERKELKSSSKASNSNEDEAFTITSKPDNSEQSEPSQLDLPFDLQETFKLDKTSPKPCPCHPSKAKDLDEYSDTSDETLYVDSDTSSKNDLESAYDEDIPVTPITEDEELLAKHIKRDVQTQNTFTAKDVAALEVIVDLMKNTLSYEEKDIASVFQNSMLLQPHATKSCHNDSTNSIQVHIAIPFDFQNGKKRSPLDPVRVRKVFSAKMSTPVDLEYQVHSFEDTFPSTNTLIKSSTTGQSNEDGLSPGMYLLIDKPKDGFALKPVKAKISMSGARTRQAGTAGTTASMTEPKREEETTSMKNLAKVTLSKDFIAAVNQHLIEMYENMSRVNKEIKNNTRLVRSIWNTYKTKKEVRRSANDKYVTKRRIDWEAVKTYFGHDRVCSCKCRANKSMCRACAASDAVIDELIFEFDNLDHFMKDHCTEIQTFFWMNPSGGQKLRDVVRRIDQNLGDYYKRVKGKCQGRTCKTFTTYIDKRQLIKTCKVPKEDVFSDLLNDLATIAEDLNRTLSMKICLNDKLKQKGENFIHSANTCINHVEKRATPLTTKKKLIKNVYSLDNINVNIICKPESSSTTDLYEHSPASICHQDSTPRINDPLFDYITEPKYTEPKCTEPKCKKRKGLKKLFPRKSKKKKLFSYFVTDTTKKSKLHFKRQADIDNQMVSPLISDGGGAFWYDYSQASTPGYVRGSFKENPNIEISVFQRNKEGKPKMERISEFPRSKVPGENSVNTIYMTVKTTQQKKRQYQREIETSTDYLSNNINQLLELFGNLQDIESMNKYSNRSTMFLNSTGDNEPIKTLKTKSPECEPCESKPCESKPCESKPCEKPCDKPCDKPCEKPCESKPCESKPCESKPCESKPCESKPPEKPKCKPPEKPKCKPCECKPPPKPTCKPCECKCKCKPCQCNQQEKSKCCCCSNCQETTTTTTTTLVDPLLDDDTIIIKDIANVTVKDLANVTATTETLTATTETLTSTTETLTSMTETLTSTTETLTSTTETLTSKKDTSLKTSKKDAEKKTTAHQTSKTNKNDASKKSPTEAKTSPGLLHKFKTATLKFFGGNSVEVTTKKASTTSSTRTTVTSPISVKNITDKINTSELETAAIEESTQTTKLVAIEESTPITTHLSPTILIINENDNQSNGANIFTDFGNKEDPERYKNLLLSIIQFESNKLNDEWQRIANGEGDKDEINFKRSVIDLTDLESNNPGRNHKMKLRDDDDDDDLASYNTPLEEADPETNTKKPEGLLNRLVNKMRNRVATPAKKKAAQKPTVVPGTQPKKLHRCRKSRLNTLETSPSPMTNEKACNTHRTSESLQICDIQATYDHIADLQKKLPSEKFETLVKNISCYQYRTVDSEFFIPYVRKGRRWDWIRHKRCLKPHYRSIKDESDLDDDIDVVGFDDDSKDAFEKFVKGSDGIYKIIKRIKRTTSYDDLDLGLSNIPPLEPGEDELYVMVGDAVTMDCIPYAPAKISDTKYRWNTDRKRMLRQDNVEIDGVKLTINHVEPRNVGSYTCSKDHTVQRNVKLSVMTVPAFDIVFVPFYKVHGVCSYDDLKAIQRLGPLMNNVTHCGRTCTIRIDEPVCQRDRATNTTLIRSTAVISMTPRNLNCSLQCRRDIVSSLVLLAAANTPILADIEVIMSRDGENETLTPWKEFIRPVVTHTLRKKDTNGHREYHKLVSNLSPGKVNVVLICPAGYYLLPKYKLCSSCPPNTSSKSGDNRCRSCPRGMSAEPGAARCHAVDAHPRRYDWWWYPPCGYMVACCGVVLSCTLCILLSLIVHVVSREADPREKEASTRHECATPKTEPSVIAAFVHTTRTRPLSPSRVILPRFFKPSLTSSRATDSQETKFELWKERNRPPPLPPIDFDITSSEY